MIKGPKLVLIVLVSLLLLLQVRLWFGDGSMEERARLLREIDEQQTANDRLEARNTVVDSEIGEFRDNPQGAIEERAREDLGLIKDGETLYLLIEKDDQ